jgi:tetratricopeptide (TPR) repeat protein
MDDRQWRGSAAQRAESATVPSKRNWSSSGGARGSRIRRVAVFAPLPLLLVLAACGSQGTPAQSATGLVTQGLKAELGGDLTTAESDYRQAIALDANNDIAHFDLGTVYDEQRNTTQAVEEYQTALVIAPNFTDALFNLAVDTAGSDAPSAMELYSKVVALQPSFAAAWLNLGFALESQGNTTAAKADWAKAVALEPSLASRIPKTAASPSPVPTASPTPKP